jgi:hypothetical protein
MLAKNYLCNSARLVLGVCMAIVMAACSSTSDTVSNVDATIDFSQYKTYEFVSDLTSDKQESYQSLETTFLKKAVARELNARGLTHSDNPQMAINFSIEMEEKTRTRNVPSTNYAVGYDPYHDVYYDGWATTHTTRIDQYTEGRLDIDAIDVGTRKLIWQGTTKGRITKKVEQNFEAALDDGVVEIFRQFPVPLLSAPAD